MFGVVPDWSVVICISGSSSVMLILLSREEKPLKTSLYIDIDMLKRKIIQEDLSTFISFKTCKTFSSFYQKTVPIVQYAVLCLFTTGKLEQPKTKLLLGEKWILQGRARCEVCRSKVRPLMLCKWKGGRRKGSETPELAVFPFYKRRMTSWVDLQSPKGLCWWGNFVPRTRRPSVNINMQISSALKQHGQRHIHPANRSVTFLQSLPVLFLSN